MSDKHPPLLHEQAVVLIKIAHGFKMQPLDREVLWQDRVCVRYYTVTTEDGLSILTADGLEALQEYIERTTNEPQRS